MTHRQRIAELDVLRIVAIIAVVVIHVFTIALGSGPVKPTDWLVIASRLARFAVPAFVMVSAALVWTDENVEDWGGFGRFLQRRALLVLLPYAAWSALYFFDPAILGGSEHRSAMAFAIALLTGSAAYHLYFVPLIAQLYLVAPVAGPIVRRAPVVVFAISAAVAWWVHAGTEPKAAAEMTPLLLVLYLPYAVLGAWYGLERDRLREILRRTWPVLLGTGLLLAYLTVTQRLVADRPVSLLLEYVFTALTVLGVLGACERLSARKDVREASASAAPYVYGVYLAHPLILGLLVVGLDAAGMAWLWSDDWFPPLVVPFVLATTGALAVAMSRTKLTRWAVGLPAARRRPHLRLVEPLRAEDA